MFDKFPIEDIPEYKEVRERTIMSYEEAVEYWKDNPDGANPISELGYGLNRIVDRIGLWSSFCAHSAKPLT